MEIKADYEATMRAVQRFGSVGELVGNAYMRVRSGCDGLAGWEGQAAQRGKETLEHARNLLVGLDGGLAALGAGFVAAAESLTDADEAAAAALGKHPAWTSGGG